MAHYPWWGIGWVVAPPTHTHTQPRTSLPCSAAAHLYIWTDKLNIIYSKHETAMHPDSTVCRGWRSCIRRSNMLTSRALPFPTPSSASKKIRLQFFQKISFSLHNLWLPERFGVIVSWQYLKQHYRAHLQKKNKCAYWSTTQRFVGFWFYWYYNDERQEGQLVGLIKGQRKGA